MDNSQYINCLARIESIKAEIEYGRLDNEIRIREMGINFDGRLNFPPQYFLDKSQELFSISQEVYR